MKTTYFGIQAHESPCSRPIIAERESEKSPRAGPGREIKREMNRKVVSFSFLLSECQRVADQRETEGAPFLDSAPALPEFGVRMNQSATGPAALNPPQQNVGLIALIYPAARVFHELCHNFPFTPVCSTLRQHPQPSSKRSPVCAARALVVFWVIG